MNIHDLFPILTDCVQLGYMKAVAQYEPAQDLIRKADVIRWLKLQGITAKQFTSMEREGLISASRKGKGKNSPLYYSKLQIKSALTSIRTELFFHK